SRTVWRGGRAGIFSFFAAAGRGRRAGRRATLKGEGFFLSFGGEPKGGKRTRPGKNKRRRSGPPRPKGAQPRDLAQPQPSLVTRAADLERQLAEANEREAATRAVLHAISHSTFDLNEILQTLVSVAAKLCNTGPAQIFRRDGDVYRYAVSQHANAAY